MPGLLGHEMDDARDLLRPVSWVRGHPMAKAGLEMAAWGLEAARRAIGLVELLEGKREPVAVGVSVGIQPTDEGLLRKVEGYLEEGYARIKIKIKPGRDVEMLRAVRR